MSGEHSRYLDGSVMSSPDAWSGKCEVVFRGFPCSLNGSFYWPDSLHRHILLVASSFWFGAFNVVLLVVGYFGTQELMSLS